MKKSSQRFYERSLSSVALLLAISLGCCAASLRAQAPAAAPTSPTIPATQAEPELLSMSDLAEKGKELLEKANAGNGSYGITLEEYGGHHTMLTARSKSGGAELHKHFADFLIVLSGSGTELTGGTIVDRTEGPNGEVHGTRLEGAVPRALHKGDIIHIPAGIPHQAIEAPGQSIIIYVIKVEVPQTDAMAK